MNGKEQFVFRKRNNYLLLIAVCIIVTGFILMTGDSNQGGSSFNANIYNFRRITLAPIILLSGYILILFSIMTTSTSGNNKYKNTDGKSHNGKI